jgi:EAL and modified HD-GYP domain-containing signal transduction protein
MTQDLAFVGRQPVLDSTQQIVGYELLFRDDPRATQSSRLDLEADTRVLVNTLTNMGTQWLLGEKQAFINVTPAMLQSEMLELLPPHRVVLDLPTELGGAGVPQHVARLRAAGFGIAAEHATLLHYNGTLHGHVSHVKLDCAEDRLAAFVEQAKHWAGQGLIRVATKVETRAAFEIAFKAGAEALQGYYFARPETLSTKVLNPNYTNIINLLALVRNNAEVKDCEAILKRDVGLSFKLLRYINSASFGLRAEVQSFRHAVTILGYRKLYRWLSLLLVTVGKGSTPPALSKTAVTRGRFAELLGKNFLGADDCDNLFVTGMFSLLDAMLEMPMPEILDKLSLPDPIAQALSNDGGSFGPIIELVRAVETKDMAKLYALGEHLALSPDAVNQAHLNALGWVEDLDL